MLAPCVVHLMVVSLLAGVPLLAPPVVHVHVFWLQEVLSDDNL